MDTQTQQNINERLARAYQEVTKNVKVEDKGDMDGDGHHEPDSKEWKDNRNNAIKKSRKRKPKEDIVMNPKMTTTSKSDGKAEAKESTIRSKLISILENKDKHTKGATPPEMMKDKLKGKGAQDMAKPAQDAIAAEPTIDEPDRIKKDMEKMTSNVKVSKKRKGDNKAGDTKVVDPNPIKDPAAMKTESFGLKGHNLKPGDYHEYMAGEYEQRARNLDKKGNEAGAMKHRSRADKHNDAADAHYDDHKDAHKLSKIANKASGHPPDAHISVYKKMKSENTHHNILDAYKSMYERVSRKGEVDPSTSKSSSVSRKGENPSMNPWSVSRKGEKTSSSSTPSSSSSVSRKGEKISMNPWGVSRKGEVPQSKLKPNPGAGGAWDSPTQTRKPSGPPTQTRKPASPPPAPKPEPKTSHGSWDKKSARLATNIGIDNNRGLSQASLGGGKASSKNPTQTRKPSGPPPSAAAAVATAGPKGYTKKPKMPGPPDHSKPKAGPKGYTKKDSKPSAPSSIVNTKAGQRNTDVDQKMQDIKDRQAERRRKMKARLNNPTYKSNLIKKYVLKPRSTRDPDGSGGLQPSSRRGQ